MLLFASEIMKVYILQVQTGQELATVHHLQEQVSRNPRFTDKVMVHSLERSLKIKSRGKYHMIQKPLYPGYIFLEADCDPEELPALTRPVPGALRFLQSNQDITPLQMEEEEAFRKLLRCGHNIPRSKVRLIPDQPIQVVDGPLKGMEGTILRIDKRRERVSIRLTMSNKPFTLNLGIEIVEPVAGPDKEPA